MMRFFTALREALAYQVARLNAPLLLRMAIHSAPSTTFCTLVRSFAQKIRRTVRGPR